MIISPTCYLMMPNHYRSGRGLRETVTENQKSDLNKSGNESGNVDTGDVTNKKTKSWKNVNKNDDENDDSWRINFLLKHRVNPVLYQLGTIIS